MITFFLPLAIIIIIILIIIVIKRKPTNIEHFSEDYRKVHVVIYETDINDIHLQKLEAMLKKHGYDYKVLGQGVQWQGFGTKILGFNEYYKNLLKSGRDFSETVILQIDARDVLVNESPEEFLKKYNKYYKDQLVLSGEKACCVQPMNILPIGTFMNKDLSRNKLANDYSNFIATDDVPNDFRESWKSTAKEIFEIKKTDPKNKEIFSNSRPEKELSINLNSGLIAGPIETFITVYDIVDTEISEDDQALLTELFFIKPELMTIDYHEYIFLNDNDQWGIYPLTRWNSGKWFIKDQNYGPSFIQTPGKNFDAYDKYFDSFASV